MVRSLTGYLSEEFRQIGGMYGRALSGQKVSMPQEKSAFYLARRTFSQVVGEYYGHRYFGEAAKKDVVSNILIEVNVAEEESKFGVKVEEVLPLIEKIALFPNIQIKGLMTIAPYVKNPEENRPIFRRLRKLSVDINAKNIDNVNVSILSMGMTNDYEVAIEEGATMVRVGTGIFGERNYTTV